MVLITFARLLAEPIHEEPVPQMDHCDRAQHDHADARRAEPGQEADQQSQAPEELADDDDICWNCGGDGFTWECFDGCCVDSEIGCDDCTQPCEICMPARKKASSL